LTRNAASFRAFSRTAASVAASTGGSEMGVDQAPTGKGKEAARGLKRSTKGEERKVESEKGSDLKKGAARFDERSRSSDGKSAGSKQR
jgi:hypothetical protein